MNKLKPLLLMGVLGLASGCSHTVSYKLTEQDRWTGPRIEKVLGVMPLADQTDQSTNKVVHVDDADWRTNYRKGYKDRELATNVTAMITKTLHTVVCSRRSFSVVNKHAICNWAER